jgi:prolyl oligopeptidase PreP (S9A serine peptidase family)
LRAASRETNDVLNASPNLKSISDFIWEDFDAPRNFATLSLGDGQSLVLKRDSLSSPEEIQLIAGKSNETIFSTASLAKNGAYHIASLYPSPDKTHLAFTVAKHGSLDRHEVFIVDLKTRQIVTRGLPIRQNSLTWLSEDEIELNDAKTYTYSISIQNQKRVPKEDYVISGAGGWKAVLQDHWVLKHSSGKTYRFSRDIPLKAIYGETFEGGVVIGVENQSGNEELKIVNPNRPANVPLRIVRPVEDSTLESATVDSGKILAMYRKGVSVWVEITDGNVTEQIPIPNCCDASGMRLINDSTIEMTLRSPLKSEEHRWNLQTKTWDVANLEAEMLARGQVALAATIAEVKSADGTLVPMRLLHRRGLQPDRKRPVLIEVYGGFGETFINGQPSTMEIEFLKRGGIYATVALRGGEEFGSRWHQQAVKENKRKTMEDLLAAAKWLGRAWSQPSMIAATGSSNGGMTVASAGLLSPKTFGLIMPIAGVHDPIDIRQLDPSFSKYWSQDYGNAAIETQRLALEKISPLNLARQGPIPNFMIISGFEDSRVNPIHSERLYEALKEARRKNKFVRFAEIKNSGHWLMSNRYQNLIAWRANVVKWVTLFDFFGMRFEEPTSSETAGGSGS